MGTPLTIVGLGEAVFDVFPDKEVLGGTSLNVAVQAHQLLSPMDGRGVLLSRIGSDALGERLQAEFRARDLPLEYIQIDESHPTGQVLVRFENGSPSYDIAADAAWDHLQFTDHEAALARGCDAVSFGTMSQRHPTARAATSAFLAEAAGALKMFDVNLRMDFYSAEILEAGCRAANVMKLNDEELSTVAGLLNIPEGDVRMRTEAIRERYDLDAVIFTRGKLGTAATTRDGWLEGEPARFPATENADSVGAGDACTAALLTARLLGRDWPAALDVANRHAAFVASQPGATPRLPTEIWASYGLA